MYDPSGGQAIFSYDLPVGVCWGTKEMDVCGCGGLTEKCDFYPEKRVEKRDNLREKLLKLLSNVEYQYVTLRSITTEDVANYLIKNGVVFKDGIL